MSLCARLLVSWLLLASAGTAAQDDRRGEVLLIPIEGAIGVATGELVVRGIEEAREKNAPLIVLRMDTPGGLDSAMRRIVRAILASPIPVATYVAPAGARAASAGTYILYASHVAAMAPATNLGAATPVQIGGLPGTGEPGEEKGQSAMERKLVNDAVAYIRGLADLRGRNADWAESAVRESVSLDAQAALEIRAIDLVARDIPDLLAAIDGRTLSTFGGERTLSTRGLPVRELEPGWRARLLGVIADPNVAYLLLLIGFYGIVFELANPGAVVPGIVGAVCLLLALYALQLLPVNYAGLGLILLGLALMVSEAFVPSFGVLGLGGLAAFLFGSVILMDEEGLRVSLPLVGATGLVSAAFAVWVLGRLVGLRRRGSVTGTQHLIGSIAEARSDFGSGFDGDGQVHVQGESWQAVSSAPVRRGQLVRVLAVRGLRLTVEPVEDPPKTDHRGS